MPSMGGATLGATVELPADAFRRQSTQQIVAAAGGMPDGVKQGDTWRLADSPLAAAAAIAAAGHVDAGGDAADASRGGRRVTAVRIERYRGAPTPPAMLQLPSSGEVITVGRGAVNTITLSGDGSVSASHAELSAILPAGAPGTGGGAAAAAGAGRGRLDWQVRDLGSSNGTALRLSTERKPSRPFLTKPGHRLSLGSGMRASELQLVRFPKGCAERKGRRPTMEDACVVCDQLQPPAGLEASWGRVSFYAVYDGHAGAEASAYAKVHLHRQLLGHLETTLAAKEASATAASGATEGGVGGGDGGGDADGESVDGGCGGMLTVAELANALKDAFTSTDDAFLGSTNASAGSTAITALVTGTHILVGNCGDSRAYVWRRGKVSIPCEPTPTPTPTVVGRHCLRA